MNKHRSISVALGVALLAGCAAPATAPSLGPSPQPSTLQPTTTPSAAASPLSPSPSPSPLAAVAAPFVAEKGTRFGQANLIAPSFAAFDSQQGFVYVADAVDPNLATLRYDLLKFNQAGSLIVRNSLTLAGRNAPTRVDGVVANLGGLPIVNTFDDNQFLLVKVAGVTTTAADRYPVNNLPYARLSASASAENGKFVTVAVLHRSPDSANSGPEFLSLGRAEEDKAPGLLYRMDDPLASTARMMVTGDGQVFLIGPSKEGKLSVVRILTDRTVSTLPIELPSIPDQAAIGPDNRLYMAWNSGGQPAQVRSVDWDGNWSEQGALKVASGDYLTHVSNISFGPNGLAAVVGSGFDASGKSMKAMFLYSK